MLRDDELGAVGEFEILFPWLFGFGNIGGSCEGDTDGIIEDIGGARPGNLKKINQNS